MAIHRHRPVSIIALAALAFFMTMLAPWAPGTAASDAVRINEVESNGGSPGDWVEIYNPTPDPVDISGMILKDNDDTHVYTIPAGTSIAGNGFYVVEEAAMGFGLGGADSVRLYMVDENTIGDILVDSYDWTAHAPTTYGRCPDGTGAFATTTTVTKAAANDCSFTSPVKINEVESDGGTPGDWVELYNPTAGAIDISGYRFKDNDDSRTFAIAAGTSIPASGYYVIEEAAMGFGLGGGDSARLYSPDGLTLIDSHTWTSHAAATSYGRCPNGAGAFVTTVSVTKAAANDCPVAPASPVKINEIESNGGTPGDWVELYNPTASPVDISGYAFRDNDPAHAPYVLPAGTSIAAQGFFLIEEAQFGFGLGTPDSATVWTDATLTTVVDTHGWTPHAATSYGRCPDGSGAFVTMTSVTKGAANDCGSPVVINEIESDGGTPGDWVEIYNPTANPIDISGLIFKDNDDTHAYSIPAGTSIAATSYYVIEEAAMGFGLGGGDSARLFAADNATLIDSHTWASHAPGTTYGRCPNGTGEFATTTAVTKGAENACPGDVVAEPWPGDDAIATADGAGVLGGNMSGLEYEPSGSSAPGVLWAVKNGPGTLYRLLWNSGSSIWAPDTANDWGGGKTLRYPGGTGDVDSEGVTFAGSPSGGIYVSAERNNAANSVSRNSILRYDASASGATLTATHEWDVTAAIPATGPNLGLEAIAWIPDSFLVSEGFLDESTNAPYNPSNYPNHGGGLFFVGVEATGDIHVFALNHANSTAVRIATIDSGFVGVMALDFDPEREEFWVVCDDGCNGRSALIAISSTTGKFEVETVFERPGDMPNLNNEGFAVTAEAECVSDLKPAFWVDDTGTDGHAIRRGTVPCEEVAVDPDADDDGIEDVIDVTFPPGTSQTANPNNNTFSDQLIASGGTSGSIDRNGRAVTISELANPAGVRLEVGPGDEPAIVQLSGKPASIELGEGTYDITDPVQTTTVSVVDGEPAVIVLTLNGTQVTIVVNDGGSVTYTETTNNNGQLTSLTIDEQTGDVEVGAGNVPVGDCGDVAIENFVFGTNGNETLNGTPGNDFILARGGNDTVNGNGGDDCIDAGDGNDKVTTGDGNDVILAGNGNNTIAAGNGDNFVQAAGGNDNITTGNGNDEIEAGGGNNKIDAGNGTNSVTTAGNNDEIKTGNGNDTIDAGGGNNKVNAGEGVNSVTAEGGNDEINTGSASDVINAGGGNNKINAGNGNNQVTTASGNDDITTGSGSDTVNAGGGNNKINVGGGADSVTTASGNDNVDCGDGVDVAHVGGGNNTNQGKRCETFGP